MTDHTPRLCLSCNAPQKTRARACWRCGCPRPAAWPELPEKAEDKEVGGLKVSLDPTMKPGQWLFTSINGQTTYIGGATDIGSGGGFSRAIWDDAVKAVYNQQPHFAGPADFVGFSSLYGRYRTQAEQGRLYFSSHRWGKTQSAADMRRELLQKYARQEDLAFVTGKPY